MGKLYNLKENKVESIILVFFNHNTTHFVLPIKLNNYF